MGLFLLGKLLKSAPSIPNSWIPRILPIISMIVWPLLAHETKELAGKGLMTNIIIGFGLGFIPTGFHQALPGKNKENEESTPGVNT